MRLPLGLPDTLSRAPLRRRAPFAWLARGARSHCAFMRWLLVFPRAFAPRAPRRALSLAAAPARSVRVARSRRSLALRIYEMAFSLPRRASPLGLPDTRSRAPLRRLAPFAWLARGARSRCAFMRWLLVFPGGLRPSDSRTRALARRCAGSLRSRGSLAALARAAHL